VKRHHHRIRELAKSRRQAFMDLPHIPIGQYFAATAYRKNSADMLSGFVTFWNVRRRCANGLPERPVGAHPTLSASFAFSTARTDAAGTGDACQRHESSQWLLPPKFNLHCADNSFADYLTITRLQGLTVGHDSPGQVVPFPMAGCQGGGLKLRHAALYVCGRNLCGS
jgi:hypothetical protein